MEQPALIGKLNPPDCGDGPLPLHIGSDPSSSKRAIIGGKKEWCVKNNEKGPEHAEIL